MTETREPVLIGGEVMVHPAAELFPEMGDEALENLKASIAEHGLRVPVVTQNCMIVDGRNRARAWLALGRPIRDLPTRPIPGDVDPYTYAWDSNCERLDYDPGTKAKIHVRILGKSGELKRIRDAAEAAANALRATKAKEQHSKSNPRKGEKSGPPSHEGTPKSAPKKSHVAQVVAEKAGVSVSTAERALREYEAEQRGETPKPKPKPDPADRPRVRVDREEDGRWIAEIPSLPGALAYGGTQAEAVAAVEALAGRALADPEHLASLASSAFGPVMELYETWPPDVSLAPLIDVTRQRLARFEAWEAARARRTP